MVDEVITPETTAVEPCNVQDLMPKPEDVAKEHLKSKKQKAIEWGRPGHLTQTEVEIFVSYIQYSTVQYIHA